MPYCIYCQNCGNEFLAKYKTSKYCSRKCSNIGTAKITNETNKNKQQKEKEEIKNKRNKSITEKYWSIENYNLIQHEKSKATKLLRYGDENYNNIEKYRLTMSERYNTSNGFNLQISIDKRQQTMLEKYGVRFPMQHETFFKKATNTYIERYGEFVKFNSVADELNEYSINCISKALGLE